MEAVQTNSPSGGNPATTSVTNGSSGTSVQTNRPIAWTPASESQQFLITLIDPTQCGSVTFTAKVFSDNAIIDGGDCPPNCCGSNVVETTGTVYYVPECEENGGEKYVQWPNLYEGFDLWNSSPIPPQVTNGPWVLADDFICTNTGSITDIHLWGSWLNLPGAH